MKDLKNLKIAIVTEELTQLGGSERLLDYYLELFPRAPVYTLVWDKEKTKHRYDRFDIRTSFIQKLPFGVKKYKWYLALMPKAVESFKFDEYDLVLSITSALVKGIITRRPTVHICYCNTPTRYLWVDSESYVKNAPIPFFIRPFMPWVISYLKKWDLRASSRPDFYIANSINAQKRIRKFYNRESMPIFPAVDTNAFIPVQKPGRYYLLVSRIEPYKKVDLAIDAFKTLGLPLKVVGGGTRLEEYRKNLPKNIELVGRIPDGELPAYYQNCKAFIFPQEEDAGITPLEAMACGRPVIAYKKGGALETVIEGRTGILFDNQTVEDLSRAVKKSEEISFDSETIRKQAESFDKEIFKGKILEYIKSKI